MALLVGMPPTSGTGAVSPKRILSVTVPKPRTGRPLDASVENAFQIGAAVLAP